MDYNNEHINGIPVPEILKLTFNSYDLGKTVSVKEFFIELLLKLWEEKEEFNGKRPFGNSRWDIQLLICLVSNKVISGKLDDDGCVIEKDENEFNTVVAKLISLI